MRWHLDPSIIKFPATYRTSWFINHWSLPRFTVSLRLKNSKFLSFLLFLLSRILFVKNWTSPALGGSVTKSCLTLLQLKPARLLHSWDFPGKNSGVGFSFHSPGDLPTQESNSYLLLGRILHHWDIWEAPNSVYCRSISNMNKARCWFVILMTRWSIKARSLNSFHY